MNKRTHFNRIAAAAETVWPPCEHRLLSLTGQSNLRSSPLSAAQTDFLASLTHLPIEGVLTGFPFDEAPMPNRPVGLQQASLQNARQYLWARSDPAYARAVAQVLQPILASASRSILIVTGSCGLQILEATWPHLRRTPALRIEILTLGPVGSAPHSGEAGFSGVQGAADLWSRLFYRRPIAHETSCGHVGCWHDAVARDAQRTLAERLLMEAS